MDNYIELFLDNKIYIQRTSTSKFIEFTLNYEKIKTYNELPDEIKKIINMFNDMEQNPDKYFDYKINNKEIIITKIKGHNNYAYVKIPQYVKGYKVTKIGSEVAVQLKNSLKQILLPNSIKHFDEYSFSKLKKIKHINIPSDVKEIPEGCFFHCKKLNNINLENIEKIYEDAFTECDSLKKISINNLNFLGIRAFFYCEQLNEVNINGDIETIQYATFCGCSSLKNIKIPDNVKLIEEIAFAKCGLEEVIFPKNIQQINSLAFINNNITNLEFDKNINVASNAFDNNPICQSSFKNTDKLVTTHKER